MICFLNFIFVGKIVYLEWFRL